MAEASSRAVAGRWPSDAGGAVAATWAYGFALAATALWLLVATQVSVSAPADNIEQLNWSHSLEGGYFKHPPLSSWLMALAARAFGRHMWVADALALGCVWSGLLLARRIAAKFFDPRSATICMVLASTVYFFSGRSYLYNHNIVMFPLAGIGYLLFLSLLERDRWRDWIGLGIVCGLGLLGKYQFALFVIGYAAGFVVAGVHRRPGARRGALVAALVMAGVFAPHGVWLTQNDFAPFRFAGGNLLAHLTGLARVRMVVGYLAQQVARCSPCLLTLALAAAWGRWRGVGAAVESNATGERWRAYVWAAVVPFWLIPLLGALTGTALQNHWSVATYLPLVPLFPWLAQRRRWRLDLVAVLVAAAAVHLLNVARIVHDQAQVPAQDNELAFPAHAFAQRVDAIWRANVDAPVRTLIGPSDWGGAIAVEMHDDPQVLVNAQHVWSPWVTPEQIRSCGAMVVWVPEPGGLCAPYSPYWSLIGQRSRIDVQVDHARSAQMCVGVIAPTHCAR